MIYIVFMIGELKHILAYNPGTSWRNNYCFVALKNDDTVVAWGTLSGNGAIAPNGLKDVKTIYSTFQAFVALKSDNTVVAWGGTSNGGIAPNVPFGGVKCSGIGVEFAEEGLHEYTNIQIVNVAKA